MEIVSLLLVLLSKPVECREKEGGRSAVEFMLAVNDHGACYAGIYFKK